MFHSSLCIKENKNLEISFIYLVIEKNYIQIHHKSQPFSQNINKSLEASMKH